MEPISTAVIAGAVGLALTPAIAAWAERVVPVPQAQASGWWRVGGATPGGQLFAVAVATVVIFAVLGLRFGLSATLPAWCWLATTGIVLAIVDLRHRRLPHRETAAMAIGGLLLLAGAAALEGRWPQLLSAVLASAAVLVAAAVVQFIFPTHTGGGDTMLYGALALYLGWFGWVGLIRGLLLAAGLTALVGITIGIATRRLDVRFPAGPSLVVGTIAAVLLS